MLMDWDFNLLAELPDFSSLQITRSYYGLGGFEARIHPRAAGAEKLEPGRVLFLSDALHKAMLIDKIAVKGDQKTASGKLVKGIASRRICVPPALDDGFFGWDRFIGSAEDAYHHYAAANLYDPEDGKRKVERLIAGENLDRGMVLPWQSRFGNLEALFLDIGAVTEIGWDILPDFAAKRYVFSALAGRDLTVGPGRVIISEKNHNANDVSYTLDYTASKTTAYVGGAGEDENRLILAEGHEAIGLDRREAWTDAGSIFETEMLRIAGRKKLETAEEKESLTAELLDNGLCQYEKDYDVGDKILLIGENMQAETRLLEMRESYDSGARKLEAVFGSHPVTAAQALRDAIWPVIR